MNIKSNSLILAFLFISVIAFSQSTETRKPGAFTGLHAAGSFEVIAGQGSEESVRIEATNVETRKVLSEVKNGTLKLQMERGNYNNIRVKVYVTYKSLSNVISSGSGRLTVKSGLTGSMVNVSSSGSGGLTIQNALKGREVNLEVSGSGSTQIASVDTETLRIKLSGSGGLTVNSGRTTRQDLDVSGSGQASIFGVKTEAARVAVSGSGSAEVTVNKTLEGSINGSGSIRYKGSAVITNQSVSGSGRIRKAE